MAKKLEVLDRIFWGTDYPFTELRLRRGSTGARCPTTCRRLGLEPEVTDEDIDGLLGPEPRRRISTANAPRR